MSLLKSKLFQLLTSRQWWLQSLRTAVAYAPSCFIPAVALAAGNVFLLYGTQQMYQVYQTEDFTSSIFIKMASQACLCVMGGLVVISLTLPVWLVHLTIFARAYLQGGGRPDEAAFKRCAKEVGAGKGYLFKVWSVASAYLLVPVFPLSLLTVGRVLSSPEYAALGLAPAGPTGWSTIFVNLGIVAVTAIVTAYSLVTLVMSARTMTEAGKTAWRAVLVTWARSGTLLPVTLAVLLMNLAVSAPHTLLSAGMPDDALKQNLYGYIAWQCWFAFSSAILWPLSVIPFCEILKDGR